MNLNLLNTEIQEFINVNLRSDVAKLLFQKNVFKTVNNNELSEQIETKTKAENKLPTWFGASGIYYPNKLNLEQTSSEITAKYKANLVSGTESLIDLTGGFGVDVFHFSKVVSNVTHCEINEKLSRIVKHNFEVLEVKNCQIIPENGIEFLEKSTNKFDWIYIDPSRRNDAKGKVFLLEDCLPNVPVNLDMLFRKSDNILIKTSPMLDISQGIKELEFVKEIHVVAVKNEVKELLWVLENGFRKEIEIKTINLLKGKNQTFNFELNSEKKEATYSTVKKHLYEPNASVLKAGGFNSVSNLLKINKLDKHSHLYTSDEIINFPGRRFKVLEEIAFNSKTIKRQFGNTKANITTRNFPQKVEEIRKKFKIKDGGEVYLFFTTNCKKEKIVLRCEKLI